MIENEPDNENIISNTSAPRYENNLLWAKEIADPYDIKIEHGGVMMPAAAAIYASTLNRQDAKDFKAYMRRNGFFVGSSGAARDAISELQFCAVHGIRGNFHWQQESLYLPAVIDILKGYSPVLDGNEFAVRDDNDSSMVNIVNCVKGKITNALLYNMDIGKDAVILTTSGQTAFLVAAK